MLVDSHCHLDHLDFSTFVGGLNKILEQARDNDVRQILSVAVNLDASRKLIELARQHSGVFATVGVHPLQQEEIPLPDQSDIEELAKRAEVLAIGETGLDNYYDRERADWQRESFKRHLQAAKAVGKPVIVHSRDAREDTIAMLRAAQLPQAGVMHCFTESWEMASEALDMGFYISFSGIITFRNAEALRNVVAKVPLERLLLETDAPWLAPVPYRGKQNQPAYVREVAKCVGELRNLSLEEIAVITSDNFKRLFSPGESLLS